MDPDSIPSASTDAIGSRFISQEDIDAVRAVRDEQWKAAYARLGQEPPPRPTEDVYDGRSLAEKLAANRAAKQEEWEDKMKLANQFRALEEDEIMFLDSIREKREEEERLRQIEDGEELKNFRQAVAAQASAANDAAPSFNPKAVAAAVTPAPTTSAPPVKKVTKRTLKGVVVKKKPKPKVNDGSTEKRTDKNPSDKRKVEGPGDKNSNDNKKDERSSNKHEDKHELPDAKRRKVTESGPS